METPSIESLVTELLLFDWRYWTNFYCDSLWLFCAKNTWDTSESHHRCAVFTLTMAVANHSDLDEICIDRTWLPGNLTPVHSVLQAPVCLTIPLATNDTDFPRCNPADPYHEPCVVSTLLWWNSIINPFFSLSPFHLCHLGQIPSNFIPTSISTVIANNNPLGLEVNTLTNRPSSCHFPSEEFSVHATSPSGDDEVSAPSFLFTLPSFFSGKDALLWSW